MPLIALPPGPRLQLDFRQTPVTLLITAIAAALELACTFDPTLREALYLKYRLGILSPIWAGEVWRPVTTTLLHGGLFHAVFNIYWLLLFGSVVERRFGSWRMLGLFVLLAYVSMVPEFVISNFNRPLDEQNAAVGLSGVIYGLLGVVWMGRSKDPQFEAACSSETLALLLGWLVLCLPLTYFEVLPLANIAHAAGLAFGVLYGKAIFGKHRALYALLATAGTLTVFATLVYCPGHPGYEFHRHREQAWFLQADADAAPRKQP